MPCSRPPPSSRGSLGSLDILAIPCDATGVPYPGGKSGSGVYQSIINLIPPHRVYIEPFLGGGAVMRMKKPAEINIGADLDERVIEGWVLDPISGYGEVSGETAVNGEGGRSRRIERYDQGPSPVLVMPTGAQRQTKRWSTASMAIADTVRSGDLGSTIAIPGATRSHSLRPGDASSFRFAVGCGIELLELYPWTGDELVYCDPPYMHETRGRPDLYRFEMTDAHHMELLSVLRSISSLTRVIISGYFTKTYENMLHGWHTKTFHTTNRAGQRTTEWLWFNYSPPAELHDYRYLGMNFRERERIKRKKARWQERLKRMPLLERQAMMAALKEGEE